MRRDPTDRGPAGVAGTGSTFDVGWVAASQGAAESTAAEVSGKTKAPGVTSVSHLTLPVEPSEAFDRVTGEQNADLYGVGSGGMLSTTHFRPAPIADKVAHQVDCDLLIAERSDRHRRNRRKEVRCTVESMRDDRGRRAEWRTGLTRRPR